MKISSILLALLVFSIVIIFHEFGHFIVAKFNKVKVIEFSLCMGPRIISSAKTKDGKRKVLFFKSNAWFEEHKEFDDNTVYSLKLLPFGGSCMMLGEEQEDEADNSFSQKSVLQRMAIIFAGPLFNFILAFMLSLIVVGIYGFDNPVVTNVDADSPAYAAGVQAGDVITEVDGESITVSGEYQYHMIFNPMEEGVSNKIKVNRNGEVKEFSLIPRVRELDKDGKKVKEIKLGFTYGSKKKVGFLDTIKYSLYNVKYWISTTLRSLYHMCTGGVSLKDISGPVGIVDSIGTVVQKAAPKGVSVVILSLLNFSILLTANLGVMNLIPIPALDGGRLLFLIFEGIRRKKNNPKIENAINMVGFILLMGLMVVILVNDVFKIFN